MIALAWPFIFACSAALALAIAQLVLSLPRQSAQPDRKGLHPAVVVGASVILGLILGVRGAVPEQLGIVALLVIPLLCAWYVQQRTGRVPDLVTLLPLGIIVAVAAVRHDWFVVLSGLVPFVAFAAAAAVSRGKGMGWDDAKLAGLAGAVLGLPFSLVVLAVACLAATVVSVLRDRGRTPVAFAPFVVTAAFVALPIIVHR